MIQVFSANVGDEEIAELKSCFDNNWMGCGPKVTKFEEVFSGRLGKPFVLVNNGSNALHVAVKLLNLPKGSKIVLPSFTFISCANAILLEGHIPVFADVEIDGNISARTISQVIDADVKAIMVVHYAGKPVDIKPIKEFGLPIIEDAAHAVDSKIDDNYCGTLGNIGVFSFDPIKNLATPDLGGVVCDDPDLAKSLRHCGLKKSGYQKANSDTNWWVDEWVGDFPKYLPNDVSAAVGLAQLKKLPDNQRIRKEIWEFYQTKLEPIEWLSRPSEPIGNSQHSYFTYLIRVNKRRNQLANYLKNNGVYTTLRFYPLHKTLKIKGYFPNTQVLSSEGLNLPLHPNLTQSDLDKIISLIREF